MRPLPLDGNSKVSGNGSADIIGRMDAPCGDVLFALVDVHHQVKLVNETLVVANIKKDVSGAAILRDDNRTVSLSRL